MPLTPLEQRKLELYRKQAGPMTSLEALEFALEAEKTYKDLGPFDPAAQRFKAEQQGFEQYALLLEKEENDANAAKTEA